MTKKLLRLQHIEVVKGLSMPGSTPRTSYDIRQTEFKNIVMVADLGDQVVYVDDNVRNIHLITPFNNIVKMIVLPDA